MSTTTVGDLLDRAEILARSLRTADTEISTNQWRSFDATTYRLLHELVGPERTRDRAQIIAHATVGRILTAYPSPLAAPNPEATYNARQAASHLGVARGTVMASIRSSRLPATFDGPRYSIKATDLPASTEVQPADPASTDPLDRLSCTLGVLADMVVAERSRQRASLASTHCARTLRSPRSWAGCSPSRSSPPATPSPTSRCWTQTGRWRWLNAGVPPTQVGEWAGHSVNVLLRVYAKCVYGQDEVARIRIEAALALTTATEQPNVP